MRLTVTLVSVLAVLRAASALTLQVEPRSEECFFQDVKRGQDISATYQVIRGGLLDINVKMFDPQDVALHAGMHFSNREDQDAEGRLTLNAEKDGPYMLCFDNMASKFTAKVLTFTFSVGESADDDLLKPENLNPIRRGAQALEQKLVRFEKDLRYLRAREVAHRDVADTINWRVQWWSIIETLVLVFMSVFQTVVLRRWFESPGKLRSGGGGGI